MYSTRDVFGTETDELHTYGILVLFNAYAVQFTGGIACY